MMEVEELLRSSAPQLNDTGNIEERTRNNPSNNDLACVASVSVGFGSKKIAARKWSEYFWLSLPIFHAGKAPKIPFFAPKPHGNACYAS